MENIVKELVKVDLHIHSAASVKDGAVVSQNTIENTDVLINKLKEQLVDMIAITDHNAFDYALYTKLKTYEGNGIKKVLPGIEFDVEYIGERVHVVTIFNDTDNEKIELIDDVLKSTGFDAGDMYKEKTFKDILKAIDLNVLIIAHQKSDVRAPIQNENLSKIGEKEFDNIIGVDYFDAVEFRSGKVEGILKNYRNEKGLENLRFITGTDCHVWSVYPKQREGDNSDIKYSYLKCLPTFKGLVMALTDYKRVTTATYPIREPYIENIEIEINNDKKKVALSSGLNVIIGDNSIGKSLILEKLLNPKLTSISNTSKKEGYKNYLKDNKIKITAIEAQKRDKINFDRQGDIRERFKGGTQLLDVDFFKDKFKKLDTTEEYNSINQYVDEFLKHTEESLKKKKIDNELMYDVSIPSEIEDYTYKVRIIDNLQYTAKDFADIIKSLTKINNEIIKLKSYEDFEDINDINEIEKKILGIKEKYEIYTKDEQIKVKVINSIKKISDDFEQENIKTSQAQENVLTNYRQNIEEIKKRIINKIIIVNQNENDFLGNFKTIKIKSEENIISKYKFVTKTKKSYIEKKDIIDILTMPLKNCNTQAALSIIDKETLKNRIKKIYVKSSSNAEENYKKAIDDHIKSEILKQETKILYNDDDISSGKSQGKNALMYLDILAEDKTDKMYIVDQPGDDISHINLNKSAIDVFKRMADNKQVLFVTHKPELVVNLDVDNVIVIKQNESNGKIEIVSGALEYENEEKQINILKDVADILDGGEETIRKRWKRYDK